MAVSPEERGSVFEMFGVSADRAVALASDIDDVMAQSILALDRSAIDVGREWGPDFKDIPKPGLVLIPSEDPFLSTGGAETAAGRTGASLQRLEGIGHWWMLQDPAQGAQVLESFWASLN